MISRVVNSTRESPSMMARSSRLAVLYSLSFLVLSSTSTALEVALTASATVATSPPAARPDRIVGEWFSSCCLVTRIHRGKVMIPLLEIDVQAVAGGRPMKITCGNAVPVDKAGQVQLGEFVRLEVLRDVGDVRGNGLHRNDRPGCPVDQAIKVSFGHCDVSEEDRKSTRLNSSHMSISYA